MQLLFLGAAIDCWCYECSFSFSFTFLCEFLPKKESELLALYALNALQMTFHLHQRHVTEILSGYNGSLLGSFPDFANDVLKSGMIESQHCNTLLCGFSYRCRIINYID